TPGAAPGVAGGIPAASPPPATPPSSSSSPPRSDSGTAGPATGARTPATDHALDETRQLPAAHHIPADPRMPIQPSPPGRNQQAKPPAARTQHPAVSQTTLPPSPATASAWPHRER